MNPTKTRKPFGSWPRPPWLSAVAWLSRPTAAIKSEAAVLGTKLFPDFKDPGAVDSLQVLRYDQAKGESLALEVAKATACG